jgi:adenylate cyclase class IV
MLEIELKFKYDDDIHLKLDQFNAKHVKTYTTTDKYFDNRESVFLFSNDYWLRERKIDDFKIYELKYPYDYYSRESLLCKYYESQDEQEICNLIVNLLGTTSINKYKSVEQLIHELKLGPIITIETKRKTYEYKNFKIDLDETNFGYRIGEIELLCSNSDHKQADEQIKHLAEKIGLNPIKKIPSKVHEYLKLFEMDIFNKLRLK